jgi:hypothetical protein
MFESVARLLMNASRPAATDGSHADSPPAVSGSGTLAGWNVDGARRCR